MNKNNNTHNDAHGYAAAGASTLYYYVSFVNCWLSMQQNSSIFIIFKRLLGLWLTYCFKFSGFSSPYDRHIGEFVFSIFIDQRGIVGKVYPKLGPTNQNVTVFL